MATSLGYRKTDFRSFIYSQSSTNTENSAKTGPVDVEIVGLTEIVLKKYIKINKKQKQNMSLPLAARSSSGSGRANSCCTQERLQHFG